MSNVLNWIVMKTKKFYFEYQKYFGEDYSLVSIYRDKATALSEKSRRVSSTHIPILVCYEAFLFRMIEHTITPEQLQSSTKFEFKDGIYYAK